MKKIFVAAAIIAMFAAVSCKNNEKKAEEAPCCPETEAPAADPTVGDQLQSAAEDAAVEVGTAAIDAAADAVIEKL